MAAPNLKDILPPREEEEGLRWRVVVPVATNPFILIEFIQVSIIGCVVVLLSFTIGLYLTEGVVYPEDVLSILRFIAQFVGVVFALFFLLTFALLKNRYYAVYRLDRSGVFCEVIRGRDQREKAPLLCMRPYPVEGEITPSRTHSRHLIWEKVSSFQDISGMRAVMLRRGFWHMLKLYSPDAATHSALVAYLRARFPNATVPPAQGETPP